MKATSVRLLDEIADEFNQFLKYGDLSPFSKEIDPNLNIDNIEKLLRIHFVLTSKKDSTEIGVIDFIKQLPQRLRRIKTTVKQETEIFDGGVRGRINWNDTIKQRYNQDPNGKTLFVCDKREKNYNIPENIILKSLLQIVHKIVYSDLSVAFKNEYEWLKGWVKEKELKDVLNQLFFRNVYLKRIDLTNTIVTDRMISSASKSRIPLYREAAFLLSRYRKLMNYELDPREAKELLINTFIKPEKIDVLFELYWAIKIIKQFKNAIFQLIEPGSNIVAKWESDGYRYVMYHNSTGIFGLKESIEDLNKKLGNRDNYLGRELKVLEKIEQMAQIKPDKSLWGGRPDIILEKYGKADKIMSVFIGEVKYTDDWNYAIQGLKELLEYMALIKKKGVYIENYANLFGKLKMVKGGLFLDKIKNLNIKSDEEIQIVMFGEDIKITC